MAQPPSIRRLLVEDFPKEQRQWIGSLLQILNQFMEETGFVLSKNVSFAENVLVDIKDLTFKGNVNIKGDITSGSNTILNISSNYDLKSGVAISGDGIPTNTRILSVSGSTLTITNNATKTIIGVPLLIGNNYPLFFRYTLSSTPLSIQILDISENVSNSQFISESPHIDWDYDGNQIRINNITGLRLDVEYRVKLGVLGS